MAEKWMPIYKKRTGEQFSIKEEFWKQLRDTPFLVPRLKDDYSVDPIENPPEPMPVYMSDWKRPATTEENPESMGERQEPPAKGEDRALNPEPGADWADLIG